jgi:hypothetical protein
MLEKLRKAAAANGRNPVRTVNRQTPLCGEARKRMAANCKTVNTHGKEGVSGSSPEEGFKKPLARGRIDRWDAADPLVTGVRTVTSRNGRASGSCAIVARIAAVITSSSTGRAGRSCCPVNHDYVMFTCHLTTAKETEREMHAQIITYTLNDISQTEYLKQMVEPDAPILADVSGLISKVWLADEGNNTFGGFYLWESKEDMDSFMQSDLVATVVSRPFVKDVSSVDYAVNEAASKITRGLK